MKISVVICTHNRRESCLKAVRSLLAQNDVSGQFEIIVVDNSSSETAAAHFAATLAAEGDIRFIHTTEVGLSRARNLGAAAAHGSIIAYMDDDAIASRLWVRSLIDAFATLGEAAGAIGGPVRPIWVEPPPHWMNDRVMDILAIVDHGTEMRPLRAEEWLAGCNIAFSREALFAVGGFDTGLGRVGGSLLSNEETVVCSRLRALGFEIVYAPAAVVDHVISPSRATIDFVRRRVAWQAVSDALAYPERSRAGAVSNLGGWGPFARCLKALRFYRLLGRHRGSVSRRDCDFIYDLVIQLTCREITQHEVRRRPARSVAAEQVGEHQSST